MVLVYQPANFVHLVEQTGGKYKIQAMLYWEDAYRIRAFNARGKITIELHITKAVILLIKRSSIARM